MSGLLVADTIQVDTTHGSSKIELCLGSVTKTIEPVDVLVISAYPGDYTPTAASVIGALLRELSISVRELAKNKEEDLRKYWSCWWSKPLPENKPYKRIMCFEGSFKKNASPPTTISEVFRSLVSLCKNKDTTVMMPLLAAGDQRYNKNMMLRIITEAAIKWIEVGLPLKVLKVVVYSRNPTLTDKDTFELVEKFKNLKANWMKIKDRESEFHKKPSFEHDVYLAYSREDYKSAKLVNDSLIQIQRELRVYMEEQDLDQSKFWQDEIYKVMVKCERVVALLSPAFLSDPSCIEKYNIALCCAHAMERDYLAPLYLQEVNNMPTYMGLIQYLDCRPNDYQKIKNACENVHYCLKGKSSSKIETLKNNNQDGNLSLDDTYDVFISYSHKDTDIVSEFTNHLKVIRPKWNIFIDQSGLRAGSSWQSKLYTSIENSKVVLAFLSYNYLASKVCQEEYNLARSLNDDPSYFTKLLELKVELVDVWPAWCTPVNFIDISNQAMNGARVNNIAHSIEYINDGVNDIGYALSTVDIKERTSIWRKGFYEEGFPIIHGQRFDDENCTGFQHAADNKFDIVLSFHKNDAKFAQILITELKLKLKDVSISLPTDGSLRLHLIDETSLFVPLLSNSYIESPEMMGEFQTALCRHRFENQIILFPVIVGSLSMRPVYPQLCVCLFSIYDSIWESPESCFSCAAKVICNVLSKRPYVETSFKTFFSMLELQEWSNFRIRNQDILYVSPLLFAGGSNSSHTVAVSAGVSSDAQREVEKNVESNEFIPTLGAGSTCVAIDEESEVDGSDVNSKLKCLGEMENKVKFENSITPLGIVVVSGGGTSDTHGETEENVEKDDSLPTRGTGINSGVIDEGREIKKIVVNYESNGLREAEIQESFEKGKSTLSLETLATSQTSDNLQIKTGNPNNSVTAVVNSCEAGGAGCSEEKDVFITPKRSDLDSESTSHYQCDQKFPAAVHQAMFSKSKRSATCSLC